LCICWSEYEIIKRFEVLKVREFGSTELVSEWVTRLS